MPLNCWVIHPTWSETQSETARFQDEVGIVNQWNRNSSCWSIKDHPLKTAMPTSIYCCARPRTQKIRQHIMDINGNHNTFLCQHTRTIQIEVFERTTDNTNSRPNRKIFREPKFGSTALGSAGPTFEGSCRRGETLRSCANGFEWIQMGPFLTFSTHVTVILSLYNWFVLSQVIIVRCFDIGSAFPAGFLSQKSAQTMTVSAMSTLLFWCFPWPYRS